MNRFEQLLKGQLTLMRMSAIATTALVGAGCSTHKPDTDPPLKPTTTTTSTSTASTNTTSTSTSSSSSTSTSTSSTTTTTTMTGYCGGATLPADWNISTGYHAVAPGDPCPSVASIPTLGSTNCCPDHMWRGEVCSYTQRTDNMVTDYYGGWRPAQPGDTGVMDVCWYQGVFEVDQQSCCGRPLLREGQPLLAALQTGEGDWSAHTRPDVSGLPDALRHRAGQYWLHSALLEHASVASFARFTLELMRFGAPPELLIDAQRAGLDEVEHARLCFALANTYLEEPVAPARMALDADLGLADNRQDFAEALVREGCIGETLAALDAAARLQRATDPAIRKVLQVIIDDESRHAALAWRTLNWLLESDLDGSLRAFVDDLMLREAQAFEGTLHRSDALSAAHGLLSPTEQQAVFADAWERVIGPAWASMA